MGPILRLNGPSGPSELHGFTCISHSHMIQIRLNLGQMQYNHLKTQQFVSHNHVYVSFASLASFTFIPYQQHCEITLPALSYEPTHTHTMIIVLSNLWKIKADDGELLWI